MKQPGDEHLERVSQLPLLELERLPLAPASVKMLISAYAYTSVVSVPFICYSHDLFGRFETLLENVTDVILKPIKTR